jgi:small subunit ribosomal protein S27Ae
MPEPAAKPEKKEKKKTVTAYKAKKMCPKCNSRMAEHADRYTCGKCSYTEFKQKK